jgi:hypothetical protein
LGQPLSDFIKVNFKYKGIDGDFDFKNIYLIAKTATFSGYIDAQNDDALHFGKVATGDAKPAGTVLPLSITIDPTQAATVSGTDLFFALYVQMGTGSGMSSYTIYDVEFVE